MCGFDEVWRGACFGGEPIRRTEIEVRVGKLKNEKNEGKDEDTGGVIKVIGDRWIGFGGYEICPLRVVLCMKTRGLL